MPLEQHNPPHPGKFIKDVYLKPLSLSANEVSKMLGVSPSTFTRLVSGKSDISSEMAIRLEKVLGRSAQSWMTMQDNYDLNNARQEIDVSKLQQLSYA